MYIFQPWKWTIARVHPRLMEAQRSAPSPPGPSHSRVYPTSLHQSTWPSSDWPPSRNGNSAAKVTLLGVASEYEAASGIHAAGTVRGDSVGRGWVGAGPVGALGHRFGG